MIAKALEFLLKWAWPEAPKWLLPVLLDLLPEIIELIKALRAKDETAPAELILAKARLVLDEGLDSAPYWSELTERERDEILDALVTLAGFAAKLGKLTDQPQKRTLRDLRRGLRKARKAMVE